MYYNLYFKYVYPFLFLLLILYLNVRFINKIYLAFLKLASELLWLFFWLFEQLLLVGFLNEYFVYFNIIIINPEPWIYYFMCARELLTLYSIFFFSSYTFVLNVFNYFLFLFYVSVLAEIQFNYTAFVCFYLFFSNDDNCKRFMCVYIYTRRRTTGSI